MKIFILLLLVIFSLNSFGATCTSTTRTNYVTSQVLTSSALNADFNQLVTKANSFDGGCVADGTLELSAMNTTDYAPVLKGIQEGCKVSYSSASTISVGRCLASVNGAMVATTSANTAAFGCSGCSAEVASTTYYAYIKTGSTGTTLTPSILTTAPNEDGYNASGDKVLARFYNNASSNIDQYSIDQWHVNKFVPQDTGYVSYTPVGTWVSNTTYTGKWRRLGSKIIVDIGVILTGAPTSATLLISLPDGLIVDDTNMISDSSVFSNLVVLDDNTATLYSGKVLVASADPSLAVPYILNASATYATHTAITQAIPVTFASADTITMYFSAPILGWND
jgi:hypothetical protein